MSNEGVEQEASTVTLSELRGRVGAVDSEAIGALALELLKMWAPPGREGPVAERLARAFREVAGLEEVTLDHEFPNSPSVIAWLRGGEPGPTIQWHGHTDAIDVPHAPPYRDGDTLHGRGSCDMRAACAAMVEAARMFKAAGLPARGNVLITLHGLHESGGNEPLHRLIARGVHGDAVISGEVGGGRTLCVATLGLTFWEIVIQRAGGVVHETNAGADMVMPIRVGVELTQRLATLNARLRERVHTYLGSESVYVGKFVSGDYNNTVPDRCELAGTRRHGPGTTLGAVGEELEAIVDELRRASGAVITTKITPISEAWTVDTAHPLIVAVRQANREITGRDLEFIGTRSAGNAGHFWEEAGIPTAYYGAEYATAHSDHEQVSVRDLGRIAAGFALASAIYLENADAGRPAATTRRASAK